jgi:hypothetical protein
LKRPDTRWPGTQARAGLMMERLTATGLSLAALERSR